MFPNPMLMQLMQKAQMGGKAMGGKMPGPAMQGAVDPAMMQKQGAMPNKMAPSMMDRMQAAAPMMAQLAAQQQAPAQMGPGPQPLPMQMMALNPQYDFQRFQFGAPGAPGQMGLL